MLIADVGKKKYKYDISKKYACCISVTCADIPS